MEEANIFHELSVTHGRIFFLKPSNIVAIKSCNIKMARKQ